MNKIELNKSLSGNNISPNAYSLEGGLPNERYCIDYESGKWIVYYSERGVRSGLKTFDNESDACYHLRTVLIGDKTTKI